MALSKQFCLAFVNFSEQRASNENKANYESQNLAYQVMLSILMKILEVLLTQVDNHYQKKAASKMLDVLFNDLFALEEFWAFAGH